MEDCTRDERGSRVGCVGAGAQARYYGNQESMLGVYRRLVVAISAVLQLLLSGCCPVAPPVAHAQVHVVPQLTDQSLQPAAANELRAITNIAALRALAVPISQGEVRVVAGYHNIGDGGGGVFVWDAHSAAADNSGTIIGLSLSPLAGRWIRICSGPVNVKWFGATGNGRVDDTDAFERLIRSQAGPTGQGIYLPHGEYLVTRSLPRVQAVTGEDQFQTRIYFRPQKDGEVLFDCSPDELMAGALSWQPTLRNLTILGSGTINKTGIRFWHVRNGVIDHVRVHFGPGAGDNSKHSVALSLAGTDESTISDSLFFAARPIVVEKKLQSPRDFIDHVTFTNMVLYGISTHPLVEVQIPMTNVLFTGRQVWVGGSSGFYMDSATGINFDHLTLENIRWEGGNQIQSAETIRIRGAAFPNGSPGGGNLTIRNSRFGIYKSFDGIFVRNVRFVLLEDINGSIGVLPDKGQPWPGLYNVDGSCMHVTVINGNAQIGDIAPKIGRDLRSVFSVGSQLGNFTVPYTAFYVTSEQCIGAPCGHPYVGLMDTRDWTFRGIVASKSIVPVTAELITKIKYARIDVTVMDNAKPLEVNGTATYDVILQGTGSSIQIIAKKENGIEFGIGTLSAGTVGFLTDSSAIRFQSEYGRPLDVYIKASYYPVER